MINLQCHMAVIGPPWLSSACGGRKRTRAGETESARETDRMADGKNVNVVQERRIMGKLIMIQNGD